MSAPSHRSLYLRISVTDGCAFRCLYCQPEPRPAAGRTASLSATQIGEVTRVLAASGVTRVRLTGGEPLSRGDCPQIIASIRAIEGIREIALTTNGQRLASMAAALGRAGLDRVNLHLDTLRPDRFRALGGRGELDDVLRGLEAAQGAGLLPIKVNTVLMRGLNDDEILDLCAFARDTGVTVRFIELMDTGPAEAFVRRHFMSAAEARRRIESTTPLIPRFETRGASPAREYLLWGGRAKVGFVAAVSEPFCGGCNRWRLSADGQLRACLHQPAGVDLRAALTSDAAELARLVQRTLASKQSWHPGVTSPGAQPFSMAEVGG